MSIYTALNTARGLENSKKSQVSNVSNERAPGAFKIENRFISQGEAGARVVSSLDTNNLGVLQTTGVDSDLGFTGDKITGLFCYKKDNGETGYNLNGSFRQTTDKEFSIADGSRLLGWMYDATGNLPNTSTVSSLTPLSLKGLTTKAVPTSKIGLSLNLDQSRKILPGAGGKMNANVNGILTISNINSIITPNDNIIGALHYGDQFRLKAGDRAAETIFEYGGIATSKQIGSSSPIFGTITDVGTALPIVDTPSSAQLAKSYILSIAIGGNGGTVLTFQASNVSGRTGSGQFSSVADLTTAVNATGVLIADISGGRLQIASKDANQSLTFTENNLGGGASLIKMLGIDNVPDTSISMSKFSDRIIINRFATIGELQKKINISDTGLISTIDGAGLDFSAKSPLEQLQIGGRSVNARSIYTATAGYTPTTANYGTWPQNTVATIQANNNFLKTGDYVRLNGSGLTTLADGIYKVLNVSPDSFVVGTTANLAATNIGDAVPNIPTNGNFTWQKIDGGNVLATLTSTGAAQCATNVTNTAAFTNLAGMTDTMQLAVNDVVYVAGSNSIRDGYYRVNTQGAGALTLSITNPGIVPPGTAIAAARAFWGAGNDQAAFAAGTIGAAADTVQNGDAVRVHSVASVTAAQVASEAVNTAGAGVTLVEINALKTSINAVITDAQPGGAISQVQGIAAGTADAVLTEAQAALTAADTLWGVVNNNINNITPAAGNDLAAASHVAGAEANSLKITKVAGAAFDSFPLETTGNTNEVKIHITPGSSYPVNGVIAFRNLPVSPFIFGTDLAITQDRYYSVTAVDALNGTVTFVADYRDPTIVNANNVTAGYVGFNNTANTAQTAIAQGANTFLGNTAYIDYLSDTYNALGVTITEGDGQSPATAAILNSPLVASYSANDNLRNFAGGNVKGVWVQEINVYDSLGESHSVSIGFGKTAENEWAVEVYLTQNEDGTYDGVTQNPIVKGQLAFGKLVFDGNGQLTYADAALTEGITVTWKDGSTPLPFIINWGAINGLDINTGLPVAAGVTQINGNGSMNLTGISNNGKNPGNTNGYYFDEKGTLFATFDNGENVKVGVIAIATFATMSQFDEKTGYLEESTATGQVILKVAGTAGVATLASGNLNASNIDSDEEYMDITMTGLDQMLLTRIVSSINETRKDTVVNLH